MVLHEVVNILRFVLALIHHLISLPFHILIFSSLSLLHSLLLSPLFIPLLVHTNRVQRERGRRMDDCLVA